MPANPARSRTAWWNNLAALDAFIAENGRLPKQRETIQTGGKSVAVGRWLMNQRQRGNLDPEQQKALETSLAGYPVTRDDSWQHHLSLVRDYQQIHGELPARGVVFRAEPIGQWTADQRQAHRRGTLSAERVAELEQVPGWKWTGPDAEFEAGLAHLRTYAAAEGTGWVPVRYVCPDGFPLGSWARERRRNADTDPPTWHTQLRDAGFIYEAPRHGGGASPRTFAGSIGARRMPHLTVDEILQLRAVSALARAHLRETSPSGKTEIGYGVELTFGEVEALADAGWPGPPLRHTEYGELIDWDALRDPLTRAFAHAGYVLFLSDWPRLGPPGPPTDWYRPDLYLGELQGLADLWDMVDAIYPFTDRELAWLTGQVGTHGQMKPEHGREDASRQDVISRHRATWAQALSERVIPGRFPT